LLAALVVAPAAVSASETEQVEITEYQGEKLGSVGNFRENSIRGVQVVDPESYRLVIDGLVARPPRSRTRSCSRCPTSRSS